MKHYTEFDNRDAAQVFDYMEARIDALKRRIIQLEDENRVLSLQIPARDEKHHVAIRINSYRRYCQLTENSTSLAGLRSTFGILGRSDGPPDRE
jgi:uncharacterized ferritin-like protein (DUF455 family)